MSTSLPSLMTRRKKIPGKRTFDSAKIFADYTPLDGTKKSLYSETFYSKTFVDMPFAGITSKPIMNNLAFLCENPRFLNEPICFANTRDTKVDQSKWLPKTPINQQRVTPRRADDTIHRSDYKSFSSPLQVLTRYGCTPNKTKFSKGIIPTLNEMQFVGREKVSFEHQFDCRQSRKERGKLQGSIVWDPVDEKLKDRI